MIFTITVNHDEVVSICDKATVAMNNLQWPGIVISPVAMGR